MDTNFTLFNLRIKLSCLGLCFNHFPYEDVLVKTATEGGSMADITSLCSKKPCTDYDPRRAIDTIPLPMVPRMTYNGKNVINLCHLTTGMIIWTGMKAHKRSNLDP